MCQHQVRLSKLLSLQTPVKFKEPILFSSCLEVMFLFGQGGEGRGWVGWGGGGWLLSPTE